MPGRARSTRNRSVEEEWKEPESLERGVSSRGGDVRSTMSLGTSSKGVRSKGEERSRVPRKGEVGPLQEGT